MPIDYCNQQTKRNDYKNYFSMNHFEEESKSVKRTFNLSVVLEFSKNHSIEILRGEDWQYECYIDRKCYDISLTPLMALINAISKYENRNKGDL